jgi:eukaryotic-like serine/threonine-protein kinase
MITITCLSCQKKLTVKDELAGKKGKCPSCGQKLAIPVQADSSANRILPTPPPSLGPGPSRPDQRRQPSQPDSSDALTRPASSDPDATLAASSLNVAHDASLTDFLAPPRADDELGRLGNYRILKILGHGGMGVVFKAEDARLKRSVAVKAMLPTLAASPSAGQRFLREAQAMAAVEHDHIVRIYQVDEDRGVPFLAMEFLKGEPLDERLNRPEKLPLPEVLRIGREIAEALGAAHATGLIHRDIKPANIWLETPRNRVKILDFGLARAAAQDSSLTQQGAIIGTPAYMAPEQGRGGTVDARCDLFSLGVVLYRMCAGQQPFKGTDTISTLLEVATHRPPALVQLNAEIPLELSDLVMKLLEKEPGKRPGGAPEVVAALQALEVQERSRTTAGAVPVTTQAPQRQPTRPIPASSAKASENTVLAEPTPERHAKAGRGRLLLVIAALLLVLAPLGSWLATGILRIEIDKGTLVVEINGDETEARIKNARLILTGPDGKDRYTLAPGERGKQVEAGPYTIRVAGADGLTLDTQEFTLKKDGRVTVRVTMTPPAVVTDLDPDRKAAEWVLSIGGKVRVNGKDREIKADDLPPGAFQLTEVHLNENKQLSDAGLAHLKDCKNLTILDLQYTRVSDAGLVVFNGCEGLTQFNLGGTQVSDAGLAYFKRCRNLRILGLNATRVSDTGLASFKDCKKLVGLDLRGTPLSDAGLAHFKDCKDAIQLLYLDGTQVSDTGLAYFKDGKSLTVLSLDGTKVSDAGLAYFKTCNLTELRLQNTLVGDPGMANLKDLKNLKGLSLENTQVGDAGMVYLKDLKNLTHLNLQKTKVTAAKIEELKKALTGCKIEWDNFAIEPKASLDSDRKAAEYVLSIGGTVLVNGQHREIKTAADLPPDVFRLTGLYLTSNKQVSDAALACFKDCKNLTLLDLQSTPVNDAGLAHFKDCKNLTSLWLSNTQVSDAGLVSFKDCKKLTNLNLASTPVGDAGLAHFKDCKNLTDLSLTGTQVSDTGLAYFKDCKNLTSLMLNGTSVSDAGLAHFKDFKNLTIVWLSNTKVSDIGLAHLKDCTKLTSLGVHNTKVTDVGLVHFKECKNLKYLGLKKTQVTGAEIEKLMKALPMCKIEWDGGVIEPMEK